MTSKNTNRKKKIVLVLILILAVALGGWWAYDTYGRSTETESGINYDPPTKEERDVGDKQKEQIATEQEQDKQQQETATNDPAKKKTVSVIITDAGEYDGIIEVRSFVPDHYQNGTCTITFKQGGKTITKEVPARTDASTTICMNPLIKRTEFPSSGAWQVAVTYAAAGATGTSESQTLTLP